MPALGTLQEPGKAYLVLSGRRAETRAVGERSPGPPAYALGTQVGSETVNSDLSARQGNTKRRKRSTV